MGLHLKIYGYKRNISCIKAEGGRIFFVVNIILHYIFELHILLIGTLSDLSVGIKFPNN